MSYSKSRFKWISRRNFLKALVLGGLAAGASGLLGRLSGPREKQTATFIAGVPDYRADLAKVISTGLSELQIPQEAVKGKRILIKPNLVEPHRGQGHINTHPLVIRAAAESFLKMGAARVVVAEGPGHQRDTLLVLEESGLAEALAQDRIPFIDLNASELIREPNAGRASKLEQLFFPEEVREADWIVSVAKMKTHHWAGVTLSMKNLFGVMPSKVYGWPKNVLHVAGIGQCIYDITATLKPQFAIVDGIVGMEGDGPIMGNPVASNVIVMGRNLPAVDATCARVMGIDPVKIPYLSHSSGRIGSIKAENIAQRGEVVAAVRKSYKLLDFISAHQNLRLR